MPWGGGTQPHLAQLQRVPISCPADGEQRGVGSGGAPDDASHALGQVGFWEHGGHLCWVCGDEKGAGKASGTPWQPHRAPQGSYTAL